MNNPVVLAIYFCSFMLLIYGSCHEIRLELIKTRIIVGNIAEYTGDLMRTHKCIHETRDTIE